MLALKAKAAELFAAERNGLNQPEPQDAPEAPQIEEAPEQAPEDQPEANAQPKRSQAVKEAEPDEEHEAALLGLRREKDGDGKPAYDTSDLKAMSASQVKKTWAAISRVRSNADRKIQELTSKANQAATPSAKDTAPAATPQALDRLVQRVSDVLGEDSAKDFKELLSAQAQPQSHDALVGVMDQLKATQYEVLRLRSLEQYPQLKDSRLFRETVQPKFERFWGEGIQTNGYSSPEECLADVMGVLKLDGAAQPPKPDHRDTALLQPPSNRTPRSTAPATEEDRLKAAASHIFQAERDGGVTEEVVAQARKIARGK